MIKIVIGKSRITRSGYLFTFSIFLALIGVHPSSQDKKQVGHETSTSTSLNIIRIQ